MRIWVFHFSVLLLSTFVSLWLTPNWKESRLKQATSLCVLGSVEYLQWCRLILKSSRHDGLANIELLLILILA